MSDGINDLSGIGGAGSGGIVSGPGGTGITLTDVQNAYKVAYVTLTVTDIMNGYTLLPFPPVNASRILVGFKGGLNVFNTDAYEIDTVNQRLVWSGKELDGIVEAGDKLQLTYFSL